MIEECDVPSIKQYIRYEQVTQKRVTTRALVGYGGQFTQV